VTGLSWRRAGSDERARRFVRAAKRPRLAQTVLGGRSMRTEKEPVTCSSPGA
jgi:hypothetical protein